MAKKKAPPVPLKLKPILALLKEMRQKRYECQGRVTKFRKILVVKLNREAELINEIGVVSTTINRQRHLIEMYKVMDEHRIFEMWQIEKAAGLTTKNCPQRTAEFQKTKDGFKLEV